jgi:hypothetical protein
MQVLSSFRVILIGLLMAEGSMALWLGPARPAAVVNDSAERRPVLVELFTSEGCSSCPPADALLAKLDAMQVVPGAQVIVLSEHVTYWNHDGWVDPFSLDAMTARQQEYVERFGIPSSYTPQAVVDGAAEMVGSDGRKLVAAVEQAASSPKPDLTITDAQWDGKAVKFTVKGAANPKTELMAALAEDSVQSAVARGENAGRNLRHVAVVRVMAEMGKGADDGRTLTLKAPSGGKQGEAGAMRLVVFVTDRHSGHVMAAAERTIAR